jgi:septum formation inhibitor MinC
MSRWPTWRFEKALLEVEKEENLKRINDAKAEAAQAFITSQEQLAEVRELTRKHKPIREQFKKVREKNHFTEGLLRIIEEGR